MLTVKEVSELTGVSIRTLQYYDKIDLLRPKKQFVSIVENKIKLKRGKDLYYEICRITKAMATNL